MVRFEWNGEAVLSTQLVWLRSRARFCGLEKDFPYNHGGPQKGMFSFYGGNSTEGLVRMPMATEPERLAGDDNYLVGFHPEVIETHKAALDTFIRGMGWAEWYDIESMKVVDSPNWGR